MKRQTLETRKCDNNATGANKFRKLSFTQKSWVYKNKQKYSSCFEFPNNSIVCALNNILKVKKFNIIPSTK